MTDREMPAGPCLLLDATLAVVQANAAAQHLLRDNAPTLAVRQQRLQAAGDPQALARCLALAQRGNRAAVSLLRPGQLPLTLRAELQRMDGGAFLRVTLRDPELERPDPLLLQGLFGLTPTEALVAAGLAQGLNSASMARQMGVQPNTVLSHIKRVLTKSGARRQSQFVSLVLRSVAMPQAADFSARSLPPAPGLAQMGNEPAESVGHSERRPQTTPRAYC
jgi:DNA-binding CsgD family transcriptional regulator